MDKTNELQLQQENLYPELNREQREAVLYGDGPLLILAGAGSGKTRVVTYRISDLIQRRQVAPERIMALTFTNKAASEMKERIAKMLNRDVQQMWIGTFHSMMVRVLRQFASLLSFNRNFQILDSDDQVKLIKELLEELNLQHDYLEPRAVLSLISKQKSKLCSPEDFVKEKVNSYYNDPLQKACLQLYPAYQKRLLELNAMDFDDLLFHAYRLFMQHPQVLELYRERFQYIFVDEYQDTNQAQYELIYMLSKKHRNLCVVGDDDQSIYAFRGADVRIILNFEQDFKDAKVIKLEQNYRSTSNILTAANAVISNNVTRKAKQLWTASSTGAKITYYRAANQKAEAEYVAREIATLVQQDRRCKYRDCAILYRVNALSRNLEIALQKAQVKFKIFGGLRFYERKEIKDVLAYLRLICNEQDNLAFSRIINTPKRLIGQATVDAVLHLAFEEGLPALTICRKAADYPQLQRVQLKLQQFAALIDGFRATLNKPDYTLATYIEYVQNQSGLIEEILNQLEKGKDEAANRIENLKEMLSDVVDFSGQNSSEAYDFSNAELAAFNLTDFALNPEADFNFTAVKELSLFDELGSYETRENKAELTATSEAVPLFTALQNYLEMTVLNSAIDNLNDDDYVSLMTIHAAKGLEFNNVYIIGMEDNIFPSMKSIANISSLEEERRLAYVGLTRAKQQLTLCSTYERLLYGSSTYNVVSRFVREIPAEVLQEIDATDKDSQPYDLFKHHDRTFAAGGAYQNSNLKSAMARLSEIKQHSEQNKQANAAASAFSSVGKSTLVGSRLASAVKPPVKQNKRDFALPPLAKQQSAGLAASELKIGMQVKHARFGVGKIIKLEPLANDVIVVLSLANGENKRFLAKSANLTKA